jgi:glycine cleavage system regulatory protein
MHKTMLLSILGPDRPGIVEDVAGFIQDMDGNWLESRLTRLAGQFAGMVQFSIPAERETAFREGLPAFESSTSLQCLLGQGDTTGEGEPSGRPFTLECVGQDRPGIVRAITDVLAGFGVNVETFGSQCSSAPMSGETLFHATLKVRVPENLDLAALEQRLADIGDELMLDVSFEE